MTLISFVVGAGDGRVKHIQKPGAVWANDILCGTYLHWAVTDKESKLVHNFPTCKKCLKILNSQARKVAA